MKPVQRSVSNKPGVDWPPAIGSLEYHSGVVEQGDILDMEVLLTLKKIQTVKKILKYDLSVCHSHYYSTRSCSVMT